MITPETIAKVAAANDIVDVIGSRLPLKRAGSVYKALCPFHREKTPSFNVNPARQTFKCFGCGAGGTVFKFLTQFENIDFPAAVRQLAERSGIAVIEEGRDGAWDGSAGTRDLRRRLLSLHAEAAKWMHRLLMRSPGAAHAREYLKKRGLGSEVAARWELGYAPNSYDACRHWAQEAGFTPAELIQSGLAKVREGQEEDDAPQSYDRFRDRLMFPICNESGEVIAFSGRILDPNASPAKYLNSPETALFSKSRVLFGLHRSKRALIESGSAIVCEGQIDLITAFEAGVENVIAPQGTAFTDQQAQVLKRLVREAVLCFDADNAGQQAAERSFLPLLRANLTVRVATMPPGEDPDSLIRGRGAQAFKDQIAAGVDFFDFQLDRAVAQFDPSTPAGKAGCARRLAGSVALLTDAILQEAVIGKVSARLGLGVDDFRGLVRQQHAAAVRQFHPDLTGSGASAPAEPAAQSFSKPPFSIANLLKLALEDAPARAWLLEQPWRDVLPHAAGGGLLVAALEAPIQQQDAGSVSAFLAGLDPETESFLSGLLMERPFTNGQAMAREIWTGLEKALLKERRVALESRLRLPGLTVQETEQLQKEVLDLHKRLQDIAQP